MERESQPTSQQGSETPLTAEQCRMARAGVGLGVRELAKAAKVSTNTVSRLERGEFVYGRTAGAIRTALEAAGLEFIPQNGGGPGVRLRDPPTARPTKTA